MKYAYSTDNIDTKIREIKKRIRLLMNGVVADAMHENGLIYKQNFGVSLLSLKEMAASIEPDHNLATRLWFLKIRETMILATMIEPADKFDQKTAKEWINDLNQPEIVELSCMFLFSRLPYRKQLIVDCINSETVWTQIAGFTLATRIYAELDKMETELILSRLKELIITDNYHLYKSMGFFLSRLVRLGEWERAKIQSLLGNISEITMSVKFIKNEVQQELEYI